MGFKKARPNYAWLLTGRVIRRSEYGSTECSILRRPFAWRASRVRRSRLRSSSGLRRVGGDSRLGAFLTPRYRRRADVAFECPVEGRLRFVPDAISHLSNREARLKDELFRQLDAPAGQISHWRLPGQLRKPLSQPGTRDSDLARQVLHVPLTLRPGMQQPQRPTDLRVLHACQPACVPRRKLLHVTPQHLHIQQLSQSSQHRETAGARAVSLLDGVQQGTSEPAVCVDLDDAGPPGRLYFRRLAMSGAIPTTHNEHRRQRPNQWIEALVTVKIPADKSRGFSASAVIQLRYLLIGLGRQQSANRAGPCAYVTAHHVRIAMREDDDVTRFHSERGVTFHRDPAFPFDQHVEQRDALGAQPQGPRELV